VKKFLTYTHTFFTIFSRENIVMSKQLPPYIYRMIDHIYVSDTRAFVFRDHFDIIILTDGMTKSGPLQSQTLSKTICIKPTYGSEDKTNDLIKELKHDTSISKRILLYGNDMYSVCRIFIMYLQSQYQFSNEDIYRIITNGSHLPNAMVNVFLSELEK
jgi:hypothetical protein